MLFRSLTDLIDNALALTQGKAGTLPIDLAPVALGDLARQRANECAAAIAEKKIDLAIEIQPNVGTVSADARRLGQAIDQILGNAIRFTPEGGRILLFGDGNAQRARIVISDNGPGMDSAQRKQVMAAMSGGRRGGQAKGLGLPLAAQLIEAHGGKIELMTEKGQGTAVTITLPRKAKVRG